MIESRFRVERLEGLHKGWAIPAAARHRFKTVSRGVCLADRKVTNKHSLILSSYERISTIACPGRESREREQSRTRSLVTLIRLMLRTMSMVVVVVVMRARSLGLLAGGCG